MGWLSSLFSGIGSFLNPIFNAGKNILGGAGQVAGQVGKAAVGAGKSIGSNLGSVMNMFNPGQGGQGGSASVLQSNKMGFTKTASGIPQSVSNVVSPTQGPQSSMLGNIGGLLQPQKYNVKPLQGSLQKSGGLNLGSGSLGGVMNTFMPQQKQPQPQMPVQQGASPTAPMKSGGSPIGGFMSQMFSGMNLPQMAGGMGVSALGNMMAPKVNVPNLSSLPSYQRMADLQTRNFSQMDPELEQALLRDIQLSEEQEDKQFTARWKNLRPGADLESDSVFAREWANHKRSQQERRTDTMAENRFANIQNNLQASRLEMEQLQQMAQMDIDSIMMQLGLDSQAAMDFKEVFSGIGQQMISSGMGNYNE